jgi:hypothetical protein
MKKIKQLTLVLVIFSVLVFSYPMTQVFAQGGGQCDSNPACDPTSGTCCNNQCDPGPACNANDPNALPCCGSGSNNMSSGTLPPRIPAPSGHDKMNHENRRLSDKKHLPEGEELHDALKGCLNKLEMQDQRQPRSSQHTPAPNCSGSVQQATTAIRALNECQVNLIAANQQFTSQSSMSSPASNCSGSEQAISANQALNEICISLNNRINGLQASVAALPLASDQNMRNFQQASQLAQNNIIRSFQEEVFDQHCPNSGEQFGR